MIRAFELGPNSFANPGVHWVKLFCAHMLHIFQLLLHQITEKKTWRQSRLHFAFIVGATRGLMGPTTLSLALGPHSGLIQPWTGLGKMHPLWEIIQTIPLSYLCWSLCLFLHARICTYTPGSLLSLHHPPQWKYSHVEKFRHLTCSDSYPLQNTIGGRCLSGPGRWCGPSQTPDLNIMESVLDHVKRQKNGGSFFKMLKKTWMRQEENWLQWITFWLNLCILCPLHFIFTTLQYFDFT